MPRVRQKPTKNQPRAVSKTPLALPQQTMPLDDGTLTPGGHPKSPTCGHPKLLHLGVIV